MPNLNMGDVIKTDDKVKTVAQMPVDGKVKAVTLVLHIQTEGEKCANDGGAEGNSDGAEGTSNRFSM